MQIFKVEVKRGDKEYLSVLPLILSKAKEKAMSLHKQFPLGTVTVLQALGSGSETEWSEIWVINPEDQTVEVFSEEVEEE
jgi:hypothetical protein